MKKIEMKEIRKNTKHRRLIMKQAKEYGERVIILRRLYSGGSGGYGLRVAYIREDGLGISKTGKLPEQVKGWSIGEPCMPMDAPSHYPIYENIDQLPEARL